MADAEPATQQIDFDRPQVRLTGELDAARARDVIEALSRLDSDNRGILVEVTTPGGDAELGRRLVLEIERTRKRAGRRTIFIGKTQCYSAGVTIMSAFPVRDRYLTRDCWLLIHCRRLDETVQISGPIRESLPQIEAIAAQIRVGTRLEDGTFGRLIAGSDIEMDEIYKRTPCNWYLSAEEALERRLVAGLV